MSATDDTLARRLSNHPSLTTNHCQPLTTDLTILASRFHPERHGGVEHRLWHVARALGRAGMEVIVTTENRAGAEPVEYIDPRLIIERFEPLNFGRLWRWKTAVRFNWWRKVLGATRPTGRVWATDPIQACAAIATGHRRRLVYNPACCTAAVNDFARRDAHMTTMHRPRTMRWMDRLAFRLAEQVIVSSQNLLDQLTRSYGRRHNCMVVPHGHDDQSAPTPDRRAARQSLQLPDNGFVIGFVGRIDPCKGLDFLLRAAAMMPLDDDDRVLLVGDGPDRPRLEGIARRLGITHHLHWTGAMDDPALAYAAMDLFVLPSVYESFGNVILEAQRAGRPVLARRTTPRVLTASDELIRHGIDGYLVDADDPSDLAARLQALRVDDERRELMSIAAQQAPVGARTWTDVANDYLRVLDIDLAAELTGRPRAAA